LFSSQFNFAKLSDPSGTKLGSLPSMWNRICVLDMSGELGWRWVLEVVSEWPLMGAEASVRDPSGVKA